MAVVGAAVVLSGCDGAGSGGGNAPSSLVGKTVQIDKWLASVTLSASNEARLSFGSCIGTCVENGTQTYSYSVTGPDSARFKLSYSYTEKSVTPKVDSKTTGDFDLTLDFSSANYGTANGSQSYTFVNYASNKTSDTDNVLSNSPFTLIGP
jgi:hypothetical protein